MLVPDQSVTGGTEVKLIASTGNDVVKWNWQPADLPKLYQLAHRR
jgi:hypothetical protein